MTSASELVDQWEERFIDGDHGDDDACLKILKDKQQDDEPLLFRAASRLETLQFLETNGVDLLQRAVDGSTLLMDNLDRFDLDAYRWLADRFKADGAVDWSEEDGVTPLASQIRFGRLAKARILLDAGASVSSFATIPRYGGARIEVAKQAVLCSPFEGDPEGLAIGGLKLLTSYGLKISAEEKKDLLTSVGQQKHTLREWIDSNL